MRLVSFSLYGSDKKYTDGAIANAEWIVQNMHCWTPIYYVGQNVNSSITSKLKSLGSIVCRQQPDWHPNGMFWRFRVFIDFRPEYALVRDTDSRITMREIHAVEEWIRSKKMFHIIRDHPFHDTHILGGAWGGTSEVADLLSTDKFLHDYSDRRGQDQIFLSQYLYPLVRKNAMIHDSFYWINLKRRTFPIPRDDGQYVGEAVNSDGTVDTELRKLVIAYDESFYLRLILNLKYLRGKSVIGKRLRDFLSLFKKVRSKNSEN